MGKLKRNNKSRKAKNNPLAGKTDPAEDKKDEKTRQSKIVPLINNLRSTIPSEKSMAVGALTVLCEDDRLRKLCLKERLIQNLMEHCLNDNNDELVVEAFGLLRNIGVEEGYDTFMHMWRLNIWTTIDISLEKIQKSFKFLVEHIPDDKASQKKKDDDKQKAQLLFDFTENILSLIIEMAKASEDLFQHIFDKIDPILKLTIDILKWNTPVLKTSLNLHNTLLKFLYEFSTESIEFINKLADVEKYGFNLDSLIAGYDTNRLGKGLIESIRFQIVEAINHDGSQIVQILSKLVDNVVGINLDNLKASFAPVDNAIDPIKKTTEQSQVSDDEPIAPQTIDQQISGDSAEKIQAKNDLQLLEITVDVFSSAWEFIAEQGETQSNLPHDLQNLILKRIYPLLIELIKFDDQILHLTDKILICLNNMAWMFLSLESLPTPWFENCLQLWDIAISVAQQGDDLYTQRDALNVCWAVIKSVRNQVSLDISMVQGLSTKAAELTNKEFSQIDDADFEFILVTIGFLGTWANIYHDIEVNRIISQFLFHVMYKFTEPEFINSNHQYKIRGYENVLMSLDQFIDIYSDGESSYNEPVFINDGYLSKLRELEPRIKSMYKNIDKKKFGGFKESAEGAWQTLQRFIDYKEHE